MILNTCFQPHENALFTEIENESVLLQLDSGVYYGLDEIGTEVWRLIEQRKTLDDITTTLLEVYDVSEAQLSQDLTQLLFELQQENLIVSQ